ncbi:MAG: hypothetical protein M3487_11900 [Actinomycetota bacterium]|nr:hypothetical protein [Acidimicrobiia bacterium]MDQ3470451.1 hypothetical protein [Actinomycetota bacterium]
MISVDPAAGMDGTDIFLIPGDWPGVVRGKPISKVGLRALNQTTSRSSTARCPRSSC